MENELSDLANLSDPNRLVIAGTIWPLAPGSAEADVQYTPKSPRREESAGRADFGNWYVEHPAEESNLVLQIRNLPCFPHTRRANQGSGIGRQGSGIGGQGSVQRCAPSDCRSDPSPPAPGPC